jgi:hypothetical protein
MPALSSLTLEATLGQQPLALAVIISSINDRLPLLRDLTLSCSDSWDTAGVLQVWEQIGSVTQITSLTVKYNNRNRAEHIRADPKSCLLSHLTPLAQLDRAAEAVHQLVQAGATGGRWARA